MTREKNPYDFKIDSEDYGESKVQFIERLHGREDFDKLDLRARRMLFVHLLATKRAINYGD